MNSSANQGLASRMTASLSSLLWPAAMSGGPNHARRDIWLLAGCQAMQLSTNATLIVINGLAGLALASNKALATLPVTLWVIGGMLATVPASFYMKHVGRRRGFLHASMVGIAGALIGAAAIWMQSFWLLCLGALVFGVQNAFGQYYRFAAADNAPSFFKSTAISLVLAGGLVGGIIGPGTSRFAVDLLPQKFMGAYLMLIVFSLVAIALLALTRLSEPAAQEQAAKGRPIAQIAAQPKFVVAVLASAVGWGVMYLLMTSAPLAMGHCGHPYGDAAFVVSWHVIAMYAPSFFTGALISRYGVLRIMSAGVVINLASLGIALSGATVALFWWSLVLDGVGWNLLYVGGTTLLTETYRPEEKAKAQGVNDLLIFVMMAISSFFSGLILNEGGWQVLNVSALPLLGLVICGIAWLAAHNRRVCTA